MIFLASRISNYSMKVKDQTSNWYIVLCSCDGCGGLGSVPRNRPTFAPPPAPRPPAQPPLHPRAGLAPHLLQGQRTNGAARGWPRVPVPPGPIHALSLREKWFANNTCGHCDGEM